MTTKTPDAWRAAVIAGETQEGYWSWDPPETAPAELRPFLVELSRDVTTTDTFSRVVMARSEGEAESIADGIASDADSDCPDDATGSDSGEIGCWFNSHIECNPTPTQLEGVPIHDEP